MGHPLLLMQVSHIDGLNVTVGGEVKIPKMGTSRTSWTIAWLSLVVWDCKAGLLIMFMVVTTRPAAFEASLAVGRSHAILTRYAYLHWR